MTTNIVIPLAGEGSRFRDVGYTTPKPLIEVDGKTLIEHSISTLKIGKDTRYIYIVKEYENDEYNKRLDKIFEELTPGYVKIVANGKQHGAAYSALLAKDYINNDDPLIITNCDQRMVWDDGIVSRINDLLYRSLYDGFISVTGSDSPKNSYAIIEHDVVTKLAEKEVISQDALTGIHFWKRGSDFVWSAEELIDDLSGTNKEAYVSLTYNKLIDAGKKISAFQVSRGQFWPLGTPEDIKEYLEYWKIEE